MTRDYILIDIALSCDRSDWSNSDLAIESIINIADKFIKLNKDTQRDKIDYIYAIDAFVKKELEK